MNWKMHSTHKQNQGGNYSKNARLSGAEVLLWKQREARIWHRNTTQNIFIIKLSTKEPHIKHIFYELDRIQLLEKERGKQTDRKKEVGRKIKEGRTKMKKFNNDSDFIYHFFQKFHFLSMRYKVCICYFFSALSSLEPLRVLRPTFLRPMTVFKFLYYLFTSLISTSQGLFNNQPKE